MTDKAINNVLEQMRVLAAKAANQTTATTQSANAGVVFAQALNQAIEQVNHLQQQAGVMKTAFEKGEGNISLAEVMIASQKANVAFQATVQIRNKLVEAYKDIMNMPI